jgi:hypothetical protein
MRMRTSVGDTVRAAADFGWQAQAITNFLRVDPKSGEALVGQIQLARLPSSGGNTLLTLAASSDTSGNVYLLQSAACCIANMGNLSVNDLPTQASGDGVALHILSADLEHRYHWNDFTTGGGVQGSQVPVDLDVRGSAVAVLLLSSGDMVQVGALPDTGPSGSGAPVGYLVLLPTVYPPSRCG